jgi:hypothetical protein
MGFFLDVMTARVGNPFKLPLATATLQRLIFDEMEGAREWLL